MPIIIKCFDISKYLINDHQR